MGLWTRGDSAIYDWLIWSRESKPWETEVVVVRIRESDLEQYGFPINDATLSIAIQSLAKAGVRTIAIDLFRPVPVPPGSEELEARLSANRVILIRQLPRTDSESDGAPSYMGPERLGFADLPLDRDGLVRRSLLIAWDESEQPHLSLGLVAALDFLGSEGIGLNPDPASSGGVLIGGHPMPAFGADFGGYVGVDDRGYQILLDHLRRYEEWPFVTFSEVVEGGPRVDMLRDKIVLLGTTASSVKDEFDTPFTRMNGRAVYGVELHAQVIDQLIRTARGVTEPIRSFPEMAESLIVILASLLGGAIALGIRQSVAQLLGLLAAGLLAGLGVLFAFYQGYWIPLLPPAIALVSAGAFGILLSKARVGAEREAIRELFGQYVPAGVVELLWSERADLIEGGRPRSVELPATILMADIGGSTQTIHDLPLDVATQWVDAFIDLMGTSVSDEGGVVVEYGGDGLKADFGVPLPRDSQVEIEEDARRAVRAALSIGRGVEAVNREMRAKSWPETKLRMGICSGVVAARSIGSKAALRYTTIGDAANLAAHLESTEKDVFKEETAEWRILISDSTRILVGDAFQIEPFGTYPMKGVSVDVFRVRGPAAAR